MEETIVFKEKTIVPTEAMLERAIGKTYPLWEELKAYVHSLYPTAKDEWNFPGAKYGWSFRVKDKKRAIVYLIPKPKYFQVAFVFGNKATEIIMKQDIQESIKEELRNARVYAEGRGIRIDVKNKTALRDIKLLAEIKVSN